jgi:hypothetical protein
MSHSYDLARLARSGTPTVESISELATVVFYNGTPPKTVFVKFFRFPEDGGGGEFYWDPSKSKTAHNGGTIIDPSKLDQISVWPGTWFTPVGAGVGCWVRLVSGVLNVRMFGALGNGSTDDAPAIQGAAVAIGAVGRGELYFPAGDYRLGSKVYIAECDIFLRGAGVDCTNLVWTNLNGGIVFTDTTGVSAEDRSTFSISDLTLSTTRAYGGTALAFNYSAINPVVPFGDASTVKIRNVDIRGFDFYGTTNDHWTQGVSLKDTGGVYIADLRILGKSNTPNTRGIVISAVNSSVVRFMLNGIQINFTERAIEIVGSIGKTIEGIYLSNFELVACNDGILVRGGIVHALEVCNGHIDAKVNAISQSDSNSRGSSTFKITNNYLALGDKWDGVGSDGNVVSLDGVSFASVVGNYILGHPSEGVLQNGVLLRSCNYNSISGNQFNHLVSGIVLENNGADGHCVGCRSDGSNTFVNTSLEVFQTGVGSALARGIVNPSYAIYDTDLSFQVRTGSTVVTLNSSGVGTITYPLPFLRDTITVVLANNDSAVLSSGESLNPRIASCSATTLTFDVRPNPGAIGVNVSYVAFGY